ncbi:hypothetical protein [Pseudobacteriovorax antillogorgiicola]|uniref:Uncharacterized protein n=1 Tax=Pseudobacteriovorax antillogorgiicola TaxID=1513793 RepID=A0A1Y6BLE6_9BACT|nr:hypothetical protein [Pseudobacteriovorax antillogorgiicola]TCS54598.1 hypothetical protein EDD56_106111 [Pseudobacteriovorax antillogorgiicola]SMF17666.1 hypothetical protein SAMN06296036_106132 [Pseudobacteriovorax antillogorgiicola]
MKKLILVAQLVGAASASYGADALGLLDGVNKSLGALSRIRTEVVASSVHQDSENPFPTTVKFVGNRYDSQIETKMEDIEDALISAGNKLSDAAQLIPKHEGYNLFFSACGEIIGTNIKVERTISYAGKSKLFAPQEFTELLTELEAALDDAACR